MTTSTVSKNFALHGAHTAGIFADMTVDGPEIGTLVCIVDRAKNLPNRKTIGKQDPYCAARLGKEAKKTTTDIRGGQTPRWDQELRFTVHDTADYYQLKVSVFTDDKKTDLIGETWIDLKPIIIHGGGQNDMWQTLTCRGKYAGEIRLEITYYDSRPKPEKPVSRAKPPSPVQQEGIPAKRKDVIKRRPLSSDPAALEAASAAAPDAPFRGHAKQNSHPEYMASSARSRQSLGTVGGPRELRPVKKDSYENPRHSEERELSQKIPVPSFDQMDARGDYNYVSDRDEPRPLHHHGVHPPPPPPAHRERNSQEALRRTSLEAPLQKAMYPMSMRQETLKNETHRNPSNSYPGRPKFRGYERSQAGHVAPPFQKSITYDASTRQGYDAYDPHRSMQPTVEDYPESEAGGSFGGNYRQRVHQEEMRHEMRQGNAYDHGPVASNNLSRSPGAAAGYMGQSGRVPSDYREPRRYSHSVSPVPVREYADIPAPMTHHAHSQSQHYSPQREHEANYVHHSSHSNYALHNLPPSSGVDPGLGQDRSQRMYDDGRPDGRYSNSQSMAISAREGQRSDPPSYDAPGTSPQGYSVQKYDRRRSDMHYYESDPRMSRHRNPSPNPPPSSGHAIRRKSVSPAPPRSETRRLSDVPYGPDSYDTYNPSVSRGGTPGSDPEPPSKIVTYDGREIDPSDHLPMESWAPEPDQNPQALSEGRSRVALTGAQPMPTNGRRQLRLKAQASPSTSLDELRTSPGAAPPTRGRLQKKNRASMGGQASTSAEDLQDRQGLYGGNRAPRSGGWEPSVEYGAQYQGGAQGPPIPAKVPLPIMSGANGGGEVALMEEMQKIDIGTGRSRRRGGY